MISYSSRMKMKMGTILRTEVQIMEDWKEWYFKIGESEFIKQWRDKLHSLETRRIVYTKKR